MNKQSIRKLLSFILCIALIAAIALTAVGCKTDKNTGDGAQAATTAGQAETPGDGNASAKGRNGRCPAPVPDKG